MNIQEMLHDNNEYVQKFKISIEQLTTTETKIVIRPDRRPEGSHSRQYNAPVVDDVAAIMSGEEGKRDIVLQGGSFVWNPPSLSWRRVNVVLQSFVPWLEHYLIYLSVKIDELF